MSLALFAYTVLTILSCEQFLLLTHTIIKYSKGNVKVALHILQQNISKHILVSFFIVNIHVLIDQGLNLGKYELTEKIYIQLIFCN